MKRKILPLLFLLSTTQVMASSAPFTFSFTDNVGKTTSFDINDFNTLKDLMENNGNLSQADLNNIASKYAPQLQKLVDDGDFSKDYTADIAIFGNKVASIKADQASKTVTVDAPDFGINKVQFTDDIAGSINTGQALANQMLNDGNLATQFYSGILTTFQNSPISPLAGNPASALSTMINLTSSMALAAKGQTTGWIAPSMTNSALSVMGHESSSPQSLSEVFNTTSVGGQYMQLTDGNLSFKSYAFPLAYIIGISWVPGLKFISDAVYRYSTVDNSFVPTVLHTVAVGTGFSIPFGNSFRLMPHVSFGAGFSEQLANAGFLYEASLTATYDLQIGPGNLTVMGLAGYGASIAIDSSKYVPSSDTNPFPDGFILDPKLTSPHVKVGVNYEYPLNSHLYVEIVGNHTQFFQGSTIYVKRVEEIGLNLGFVSGSDSPLSIKGGASYLTSDHHTGFTANLTVTF